MLDLVHEIRPRPASVDHSAQSRLLSALMDRIECGLLACGSQGQLYHANVTARRELDDASVLRVVDGCVRARSPSQDSWRLASTL